MDDIDIIRAARRQHQGILELLQTLAEEPGDIDEEFYRAAWLRQQTPSPLSENGPFAGDREALYQLELQRLDRCGGLSDAERDRFTQSLQTLADGLERHFNYEEGPLADALRRHGGEMFVSPLMAEHRPIRGLLASLKSQAERTDWKQQTPERQIAADAALCASLHELRLSIQAHARREEVIFDMAERAIALGG